MVTPLSWWEDEQVNKSSHIQKIMQILNLLQ